MKKLLLLLVVLPLAAQNYRTVQTPDHIGGTLPPTCADGDKYMKTGASAGPYYCSSSAWVYLGVPSGSIIFITSGTCSTGWTEATELNGKTLLGTLAANGDVGATGGSDTITPAGTKSAPAFTGNRGGAGVHRNAVRQSLGVREGDILPKDVGLLQPGVF